MACSEFDGQVVRLESVLKDVMDQFVRVRLIQCNSLDLNLFQFDYDLTFAAFFLSPDKSIYGRYGTRSSDIEASREISIAGFRKAMEGALELHQEYPSNRKALVGKTGPPAKFSIAQELPSLTGKYTPFLDYKGQVARSCIHCHMIGEGARKEARSSSEPMKDEIIYPWPMPNVVGLAFDPQERATLLHVEPDSVADQNGFKKGDEVLELDGQPMISIADVQWVLHRTTPPTNLRSIVKRGTETIALKLPISPNWRQVSDISWRTTSWDLRRIATGGLLLKSLTDEERIAASLGMNQLGLRVEHVGQYGAHAIAKKAGFKKNDIIVTFDGSSKAARETELFAHILRKRSPETNIPVTVLRQGKRLRFELKIQ